MKKRCVTIFSAILLLVSVLGLCACAEKEDKPAPSGQDYTIPQIDLSVKAEGVPSEFDYMYESTVVDKSKKYIAHPDSVLLRNGNILTLFPIGHGKGEIKGKISSDGGLTYTAATGLPESWKDSRETPTVYRLIFNDENVSDGNDKLIMISGCPNWGEKDAANGFNASVSSDEGATWSEFENFYGREALGENAMNAIVAMASLTRLKDEQGNWTDSWMGLFHDYDFYNYKTILTFDENGNMRWSEPKKYLADYREQEKLSNICEVEAVRSDGGSGDRILLLGRANSKKTNAVYCYSDDEGKTWSEPKELPAALNGERHKAEYIKGADGTYRLFVTFRSIELDPVKWDKYADKKKDSFYSEGWVAWVGTFDDIIEGREGQYRVKLAHTYIDKQKEPQIAANADTGYCGNVVLEDGTIVTSSYGRFGERKSFIGIKWFDTSRTYIVSKRVKLSDLDRLAEYYAAD